MAGVTTAAEYAALGGVTPSPVTPDWSTVKLTYITMLISQINTQKMLTTQHPLF